MDYIIKDQIEFEFPKFRKFKEGDRVKLTAFGVKELKAYFSLARVPVGYTWDEVFCVEYSDSENYPYKFTMFSDFICVKEEEIEHV